MGHAQSIFGRCLRLITNGLISGFLTLKSWIRQPPNAPHSDICNFGDTMNFTNKQLRSFATNLIWSGTLGVISFTQFYVAYWGSKGPLETFLRYFHSGNLDRWFQNNIFDLELFAITLPLLVASTVAAYLGIFAATLAKYFLSEALNVL